MGAFTSFYHSLDVGRGKRLEWVLREVSKSKRRCFLALYSFVMTPKGRYGIRPVKGRSTLLQVLLVVLCVIDRSIDGGVVTPCLFFFF